MARVGRVMGFCRYHEKKIKEEEWWQIRIAWQVPFWGPARVKGMLANAATEEDVALQVFEITATIRAVAFAIGKRDGRL